MGLRVGCYVVREGDLDFCVFTVSFCEDPKFFGKATREAVSDLLSFFLLARLCAPTSPAVLNLQMAQKPPVFTVLFGKQ